MVHQFFLPSHRRGGRSRHPASRWWGRCSGRRLSPEISWTWNCRFCCPRESRFSSCSVPKFWRNSLCIFYSHSITRLLTVPNVKNFVIIGSKKFINVQRTKIWDQVTLQVSLVIYEIFNLEIPKSTIKAKTGVISNNIYCSFSTLCFRIVQNRFTNGGNFYSKSMGNQGGEPTLGHWPQCYRAWYEIENFQISLKNLNYALKNSCNRL